MIGRRSRSPEPLVLPGSPSRHARLERDNEVLRSALAEALGKFRFVPHPDHPELDRWQGQMAPAVHERLSKIAAREGEG
jgi:hypothetical protein